MEAIGAGRGWGLAVVMLGLAPVSSGLTTLADYPFAPAAGLEGSTAVWMEAAEIAGWAVEVVSYVAGEDVDAMWQDSFQALGHAEGDGLAVVSLGRGGTLTVAFEHPVKDGPGWDLAVFENAFGDAFLELAWVEVSSDGETFVRFPNYSATAGPVGAYGSLDTTKLYGYAGKYRQGFGTPFDLSELAEAYEAASGFESPFSDAYTDHLRSTFPQLDLQSIRHVRIVDVVGDGTARSAARSGGGDGYPIYDPWPTLGSAGADIDAVAARYFAVSAVRSEQALFFPPIPPQLLGHPLRLPEAIAESGLAVGMRLVAAPSGVIWDEQTRVLSGATQAGTIRMEAYHEGTDTWAPALRTVEIQIVGAEDTGAPELFLDWAVRLGVGASQSHDTDADGFSDWLEYVAGTDPKQAQDLPLTFEWRAEALILRWQMQARSGGTLWPMRWNGAGWVPLFGEWPAPRLSPSGAHWIYEIEVPWQFGEALVRLHAVTFEDLSPSDPTAP